MNIFARELRANFKSLIIWSVIVTLIILEALTEFSGYANNPDMLAILDAIPQAMLDAFNMRAFNLTTLSGFFGIMYLYLALMLSIAAIMWGSDIISKEERDKTIEFSLTLPVTRGRVVTAKALAALVNCAVLLLVAWGDSLAFSAKYNPDSAFFRFLALEMAAIFILQLIFLSIGLLLGCAMKQYRRVGGTAVSLILVTYFFSIISGMHEKLDFLKYFSPFNYFDAGKLLRELKMDTAYLPLAAAIIIVSLTAATITYSRRDLSI